MATSAFGITKSSPVFNPLFPLHPGITRLLSAVCMTLAEQRNFQELSDAFEDILNPLASTYYDEHVYFICVTLR